MRRGATVRIDDCCEACGRSVVEQRPGDALPAYCDSCEADFRRELKAGHVYIGDEPIYPAS